MLKSLHDYVDTGDNSTWSIYTDGVRGDGGLYGAQKDAWRREHAAFCSCPWPYCDLEKCVWYQLKMQEDMKSIEMNR